MTVPTVNTIPLREPFEALEEIRLTTIPMTPRVATTDLVLLHRPPAERSTVAGCRVGFAQFSNTLLASTSDIARELYRKCYQRMPGYAFNSAFLELPYWISIINGMMRPFHETELLIIDDIDVFSSHVTQRAYDIIMFSVMNVNEHYIEEIVRRLPFQRFVVGGYTDPKRLSAFAHLSYVKSPDQLATVTGLALKNSAAPDYSLFDSSDLWMPRITLSMGCAYQCKFCAVPRKVVEVHRLDILNQAQAFRGLNFRIIYVDDKTFGQAKNYGLLREVFEIVKSYNPAFLGFTIQTTAVDLLARGGALLDACFNALAVRYIEVGIETCDDALLAQLRKPHRMVHLLDLANRIRAFNASRASAAPEEKVYLIPNLLFGIPGDTYERTISFVHENLDIIPTVNYANMSVYPNRRSEDYISEQNPADADDYAFNKSWLGTNQINNGKRALERIANLFGVQVALR